MAKFNNAKPQLLLHQPNSFMGFDKCIEVCNHHHNIQDTLITTPTPLLQAAFLTSFSPGNHRSVTQSLWFYLFQDWYNLG